MVNLEEWSDKVDNVDDVDKMMAWNSYRGQARGNIGK